MREYPFGLPVPALKSRKMRLRRTRFFFSLGARKPGMSPTMHQVSLSSFDYLQQYHPAPKASKHACSTTLSPSGCDLGGIHFCCANTSQPYYHIINTFNTSAENIHCSHLTTKSKNIVDQIFFLIHRGKIFRFGNSYLGLQLYNKKELSIEKQVVYWEQSYQIINESASQVCQTSK